MMNMAHWHPISRFDAIMNGFELPGLRAELHAPPADVFETADAYEITLDMPGLETSAITVHVENDVLTVHGERKEKRQGKGTSNHSELIFGAYQRSFNLPGAADAAKVAAVYKDGVLLVTLPKREEAKPRTIEVKVSS